MLRTLPARQAMLAAVAILLAMTGSNLYAAGVGDPEIKTDHTYFPGELAMSTLPRILTHAYSIPRGTVGSATDRDKLIKLFLWRCEHFTHLDSPELIENPNWTPNPAVGQTIITEYDSLRGMFSYGWGVCGTNHAQMRPIAEANAGWTHRRRNLAGDTGQEIGFGGLWRYVNTDQYTLHFLSNSAAADFASCDQVTQTNHRYIEWNPDLGGGYFMPQACTHGSYATFTGNVIASIPFRSLQWRDYYANAWNITVALSYPMYAEGYACTPIVYRMKRGETFTRWIKPDGAVNDLALAGRCWWGYNGGSGSGSPHANWTFAQNAPARDQIAAGTENTTLTGGMDYGNGCYDWTPSLSNSEYLDGLAEQTGTFVVGGAPMLKATAASTLVFEFASPYTICGRPTQNNASGKPDPALICDSGAMLYTTSVGAITVDVSNDMGATWIAKGALTATMDFTEQVKARNGYLLRLNIPSGAGLNTMRMRTLTMLSQAVYPTLKSGTTTVTYAAGNAGMLDLSPSLMTAAGASSLTGYTTKVADTGVTYQAYVGNSAYLQSVNGIASITYKIVIPPSLAAAGATFKQIFAAEDTAVRVTPNPGAYGQIDISTAQTGPWTQIAHYDIPLDNQLSAFWTYGRSADGSSLGGTTYYVRFTENNAGSSNQSWRYIKLNATYNVPAPTAPLTVTYYWSNGSNQSSAHTIASGVSNDSWSIATPSLTAQQKVVFSVPSGGIAPPTITTQPANATVTAPATATFTVVAAGATSYQWKKGGLDIIGATSASYTTPPTVGGDNGSQFSVAVTNAGGTVLSNAATLTVTVAGAPVITTQPASISVVAPATAGFTVVATGATSYQWKKNGVDIAVATSASYTTLPTVTGDTGTQYTVLVSNAIGSVLSNIATLTVTGGVGPPTTVTFQDGGSYTGTLDTYLDGIAPNDINSFGNLDRVEVRNWTNLTVENNIGLLKFDLSSIPSTATITSAQLDVWVTRANNVGAGDQLIMDKVTASWTENSTFAGGVPSATPSGVTPPIVTIPDASPVVPPVQFSVPGMAALVQGWVTTPGSNFGVMFTCATNINFRFASREYATAANRPMLTVTYTNGGGSPPAITTQPTNQTVTAPAAATFTVVATGATSYQWRLGGAPIVGATSASYTINPTSTPLSGGVYSVQVTNANGTTTSNNATLTVNPAAVPPVITTQPTNQTVTAPAAATFTVVATGAISYQWQLAGSNIVGATSASYTINPTSTPLSGGVYRVLVTNANGTTTSNNATLTVNPAAVPPVITTQPTNQSVTAPAAATFTVVATGAISYQWQLAGSNIVGATSASYTINPTSTPLSGGVYRVLVTNANGTTTSNNATLTVNAAGNPITPSTATLTFNAPSGSVTPITQNITLTNTSAGSITVTPSSSQAWLTTSGPLTIGAGLTGTLTVTANPTGLSGANSANLTLTNSTGGSQVLSATLTVAAATAPVITAQPTSQTVTAPAAATFTVTATGATSYQWQLAGANIAGATSSSYTINPTTTAMSGGVYRVLVTNASGTTISNNATLTVNAAGGNPVTPSVATVTFTAVPAGSTTPVTTTITLHNTSAGTITVTPTSSQTWLTTSGPLTIPAGATLTLTLTGNPTGLNGTQSANLTLTNSTGGTQTIPVSFTVGSSGVIRKRSGCEVSTQATTDGWAFLAGLVALGAFMAIQRKRSA